MVSSTVASWGSRWLRTQLAQLRHGADQSGLLTQSGRAMAQ